MQIIKQINILKNSEIKSVIDKRINEFKELNKKSDKEWFSELCFCLMTANWKAKESISIQKAVEKRNRQCGNKVKYNTELEAWNAGKFAFKTRNGIHVGTYLCCYCNKWHITTKTKDSWMPRLMLDNC